MDVRILLLLPLAALGGCVSTVSSVVTAPFKVAGKAADWATTSQDEADRNRGRALRKAEKRARKECGREVQEEDAREQCVRSRLHDRGVI